MSELCVAVSKIIIIVHAYACFLFLFCEFWSSTPLPFRRENCATSQIDDEKCADVVPERREVSKKQGGR